MIECNSHWFYKAKGTKVIDLMESQKSTSVKGGTMRLGGYDCTLREGSLVRDIYNKECSPDDCAPFALYNNFDNSDKFTIFAWQIIY